MWRRTRALTQADLAQKAGIPQPNVCALEADRLDPKLSTIRRLAVALDVLPGRLLDESPRALTWDRHRIDAFVRQALSNPARAPAEESRMAWALHHIAKGRLEASGRFKSRRRGTGERAMKQLKADLGAPLWNAVLRRLDKHT